MATRSSFRANHFGGWITFGKATCSIPTTLSRCDRFLLADNGAGMRAKKPLYTRTAGNPGSMCVTARSRWALEVSGKENLTIRWQPRNTRRRNERIAPRRGSQARCGFSHLAVCGALIEVAKFVMVSKMFPTNLVELKRWLVQELPKWLVEHPELRYTLEGMLAETFVRRDEWQEVLRAIERLMEAQQELTKTVQELARRQEEFAARQDEHSRILQEHTETLREHGRRIDRLQWIAGSVGRRWGVLTEEVFRQSYQELLSPLGFTVERFLARDEEGTVFGRPDQVELDLLIYNDLVIAAEVRASVSRADVPIFVRKIDFTERVLQRRVHRRLIISPFLEKGARESALQFGIEVYTAPEELEEAW